MGKSMKQVSLASIPMMAVGVILIIASFLLPYFAASSLTGDWTKEQAEAHSKRSAELHELAHEMAHHHATAEKNHSGDEAELKRRFEEVQKRYDEGDALLRDAQELPDRIIFRLQCIGGSILFVGLAIFFRYHRKEA
jgi:hypothetical protein